MALGYDGKLYILAFDHRGSFQKKMFGIEGDPNEEQAETIADAKKLIFEGMLVAVDRGAPVGFTSIRLSFELDTDASDEQIATLLRLTERYSVVYQTLAHPVQVSAEGIRPAT